MNGGCTDAGGPARKLSQTLNLATRPLSTALTARGFPLCRNGNCREIWFQQRISLRSRPRGFHLITDEVTSAIDGLEDVAVGMLSLTILHTSASLALNENASPDVRRDFETWFNAAVPEGFGGWTHTSEGPDDMPAHVKAALLGPTLTLPLSGGRLLLGTWQGIYLCEHRNHGGARTLVATVWGEAR